MTEARPAPPEQSRSPRSTRTRLGVAAGVVALLCAVSYFGASAAFLAEQKPQQGVDTGDMDLVLGTEGSGDNRLTIGATLAPGGSAQRQAKIGIDNANGETMAAVTLTTTATNGPPTIFTDTTDGLKVWIAACDQAWDESGVSPDYSYDCAGTQADVLGTEASPVAIHQTAAALANLDLDDGAVNYLLVELSFPADAPPTMYGQSTNISFTFDGSQRAPEYR